MQMNHLQILMNVLLAHLTVILMVVHIVPTHQGASPVPAYMASLEMESHVMVRGYYNNSYTERVHRE